MHRSKIVITESGDTEVPDDRANNTQRHFSDEDLGKNILIAYMLYSSCVVHETNMRLSRISMHWVCSRTDWNASALDIKVDSLHITLHCFWGVLDQSVFAYHVSARILYCLFLLLMRFVLEMYRKRLCWAVRERSKYVDFVATHKRCQLGCNKTLNYRISDSVEIFSTIVLRTKSCHCVLFYMYIRCA